MASSYEPKTPLGRFVNELEETVIALLLGGDDAYHIHQCYFALRF